MRSVREAQAEADDVLQKAYPRGGVSTVPDRRADDAIETPVRVPLRFVFTGVGSNWRPVSEYMFRDCK